MKTKAVILGANYYIGLSVIRCLGKEGVTVVGVDYKQKDIYGFASKYISEKLIAPHYKTDKEEYIQFLIDYAKKQDTKPVLFPCADQYVEVVDEHLDTLLKYYLIPQDKQGKYTEYMDKNSLYNLAISNNVLVPEIVRVDEDNFYEKVEILGYPCIIKPADSPAFVKVFRKKIFKVHNKEELDIALQKAKASNLDVFVQYIVEGFDDHMYTFDAHLNQNSEVTHYMTCQKNRQYPINFGASVYTAQVYEEEIVKIGTKFFKDIEYKGFGEIEFKKDEKTGKFYLIEINVRTTNINSLLYKVGINFPFIAYSELIRNDIGEFFHKKSSNITFLYAFEDVLAIRDYIKTSQLTLTSVIKSLFRKKAYAIWSFNDPKPYFIVIKSLVLKVINKILRKG